MPLVFLLFLLFTSCSFYASAPLEIEGGESITILDDTIFRTNYEKISMTRRYALSDEAKSAIKNFASEQNAYVCIGAEISIPYEKQDRDISFSLLSGEKKESATAKSDDLKNNPVTSVRLSILAKTSALPDFLQVAGGEVVRFFVSEAAVGWEKDTQSPLFSFGENGGIADFSFKSADFSAAKEKVGSMPYLFVTMYPCDDYGDFGDQRRVRFSFAEKTISVRRTSTHNSAKIYTSLFDSDESTFELLENDSDVESVFIRGGENLGEREPLLADTGLIARWKKSAWRHDEYELFRWEQFPSVILFDTKDFDVQNQFFTRLAFFAEKRGYRGRLMSDEFVAKEKGYNAHDYSAQTLAAFFEKARAEGFSLNEHEKLLEEILVENKIILKDESGKISAGEGAVVSISQESPVYLRTKLLSHECWHGIFFTDADFRAFSFLVYNTMDKKSRLFMREYWSLWASLNYDTADDVLMKNETMAYLLQQSVSDTAAYFVHLTTFKTVQKFLPELADYVVESEGKGFEAASARFRSYVFEHYGLSAGRISLISF